MTFKISYETWGFARRAAGPKPPGQISVSYENTLSMETELCIHPMEFTDSQNLLTLEDHPNKLC